MLKHSACPSANEAKARNPLHAQLQIGPKTYYPFFPRFPEAKKARSELKTETEGGGTITTGWSGESFLGVVTGRGKSLGSAAADCGPSLPFLPLFSCLKNSIRFSRRRLPPPSPCAEEAPIVHAIFSPSAPKKISEQRVRSKFFFYFECLLA